MSDMTLAPRRRPLWRLFIMPILVVAAALAWSAFWFYAAAKVDEAADEWRAREAKSGRIYECTKRSTAGFPFRFEVRCSGASVALVSQTAGGPQAPVTARLGEILVAAQVYDPKLLIAEFAAPATISGPDQLALMVNWSKARSSIVGLPAVPQRAAIVFDDPTIDPVNASVQTRQACRAARAPRGRLGAGSSGDRDGAADRRRQSAGAASAARRAVRCRCPHAAQRIEGFFAEAMAGTVS
jgi:hypothetical protein